MNEVGFLFFDKSIQFHDTFDKNFNGRDMSELRYFLIEDLKNKKNYSDALLNYFNISKQEFSEKYQSVLSSLSNYSLNSNEIYSYYLFAIYSVLYKEFWFLRLSFFPSLKELFQLTAKTTFIKKFLEYPLNCSSRFNVFTQADLNYDYFIVPQQKAKALIESLFTITQLNELEIFKLSENDSVIIKRWR